MTTRDDIRHTMRTFLFEQFPAVQRRGLGDDDSLLSSGIVDSLGVLDVVQFIEQRFGVTLSDDDMMSENFETITDITDFVAGQVPQACATNTL